MQTLEKTVPSPTLPENQRAALVSLLADEDPAVYHLVRSKLLSYGPAAAQWLKPQTLSSDPRMRRRALELLNHQARQSRDEQFLEYCRRNGEDLELEEALGMLAQTRYPDVNREAYSALFDSWAAGLRERLSPRATAQQTVALINRLLFEELGFEGN